MSTIADADGFLCNTLAHGFTPEQVEGIREAISHGIIAEALATGGRSHEG